MSVLRAVWPRARCGRFVLLTRNADVREVLERQADFETPYGPEMTEFAGGANFILGMSDGEDYRRPQIGGAERLSACRSGGARAADRGAACA